MFWWAGIIMMSGTQATSLALIDAYSSNKERWHEGERLYYPDTSTESVVYTHLVRKVGFKLTKVAAGEAAKRARQWGVGAQKGNMWQPAGGVAWGISGEVHERLMECVDGIAEGEV